MQRSLDLKYYGCDAFWFVFVSKWKQAIPANIHTEVTWSLLNGNNYYLTKP